MVPKLLLFTGYIGLGMVSFGLVLGFINEYYRRHRAGMVSRIGWILVSWGFAILGLALIHHDLAFNFSTSPQTPISIAMIIAGVGTVIATEKATGAIEVLSIISHILSYTRILGILLASVILSEVIDLIFMKGVEKSPLLAIVGIIILVLGQLFNLVIAIFEPGIQGARLLYVEFFSKFYKGNGHYFHPFSSRRNHTIPSYSLEEEAGKS
jgi:V/A-type H+-transporting ATPase subunit I